MDLVSQYHHRTMNAGLMTQGGELTHGPLVSLKSCSGLGKTTAKMGYAYLEEEASPAEKKKDEVTSGLRLAWSAAPLVFMAECKERRIT